MSCIYCKDKTSKLEVYITDTEEGCKWCDKDHCDNYDDSCYGEAYSEVKVNYCPFCGRKLDEQLPTSE